MTLREAIEHCEEVSETCSNTECAKEHLQLVTWLKELQFYRDKYQKSNKTMKLIDKSALVAEIEKLRDELQEKVETSDFIAGEVFIMNYFISLLDFIEVKEVNESLTWKDVSALRLTSHDAIELDGTEIAPPIDSDVCG